MPSITFSHNAVFQPFSLVKERTCSDPVLIPGKEH